ncbi:ANTAR domain-containing protein, partial [Trebonia sp.]
MAGNNGDDVPRLAAVVERQRRELALARAEADVAAVVAMARGVLMERHGWSVTEAARELTDMAAAAGMPEQEMAAAVLRQESLTGLELAEPDHEPRLADDPVAVVAAERARDGAELVGALAGQLGPRFGVAAVAVWLLDTDGALEMLGA